MIRYRDFVHTFLIPSEATLRIYKKCIEVRGPLGTLHYNLHNWNSISNKTHRTILQNAITGVTKGFLKKLKIQGSGYRVLSIEKNKLILKLGYSHDVHITIPEGITVRSNKYNQVLCVGIDKQALSQFCANIEKARKYNVYKQKGIFPVNKTLVMKFPGKPGLV
jgi:large subunit ribosomal protein L6